MKGKVYRVMVRVRHPVTAKVFEPGDHITLSPEQFERLGGGRKLEDPATAKPVPKHAATEAQVALLAEQNTALAEELRTLKLENHRLASDKTTGMSIAEQLNARIAELESQNAAMAEGLRGKEPPLETSAPRPNSPPKTGK